MKEQYYDVRVGDLLKLTCKLEPHLLKGDEIVVDRVIAQARRNREYAKFTTKFCRIDCGTCQRGEMIWYADGCFEIIDFRARLTSEEIKNATPIKSIDDLLKDAPWLTS